MHERCAGDVTRPHLAHLMCTQYARLMCTRISCARALRARDVHVYFVRVMCPLIFVRLLSTSACRLDVRTLLCA